MHRGDLQISNKVVRYGGLGDDAPRGSVGYLDAHVEGLDSVRVHSNRSITRSYHQIRPKRTGGIWFGHITPQPSWGIWMHYVLKG